MGYSFQLAARDLLYAPSNIHNSIYHGPCCSRSGALVGTRHFSMGPLSETDPMMHHIMSGFSTIGLCLALLTEWMDAWIDMNGSNG